MSNFSKAIANVADRKGGSIDNVPQIDFRGGNAVNTAAALANLGANISLLVCTSKLGVNLLKHHLQPLKIDLSHTKICDNASITTAIEFAHHDDKRNVMLRTLGSLQTFHPNHLDQEDYELFHKADYTCIFNWAGTKNYGTDLAKTVFNYVKSKGNGKTYYDTADPLPNKQRIPSLIKEVLLQRKLIDILSLNENEAITYAKHISPLQTEKLQKKHKSLPTLAKECAKILAQRLTSRIDLHTTTFSATLTRDKSTLIPSLSIKTLRATGAGDVWNAGNIYGDAHNFPPHLRLLFANVVAAFYLTHPTGKHAHLSQIRSFLAKMLN
jgi:sugar/nucleoside kinase (ribokinase family)